MTEIAVRHRRIFQRSGDCCSFFPKPVNIVLGILWDWVRPRESGEDFVSLGAIETLNFRCPRLVLHGPKGHVNCQGDMGNQDSPGVSFTIPKIDKRNIPGATAFTIREGAAEFSAAIPNYTLGKDPGGVDAFILELDRGLDRVIHQP